MIGKSTGPTTLFLICAAAAMACADRVDRAKFDGVSRAGHAIALHVETTGCGGGGGPCLELVKAFQLEVAVLQGRTENTREHQALAAYHDAADAYAFFERLRTLEVHEVVSGGTGEQLLVSGTNEASAKRFNIPLEQRGSTMWADSGEALRISLAFAKQRFAEAERILTGTER